MSRPLDIRTPDRKGIRDELWAVSTYNPVRGHYDTGRYYTDVVLTEKRARLVAANLRSRGIDATVHLLTVEVWEVLQ